MEQHVTLLEPTQLVDMSGMPLARAKKYVESINVTIQDYELSNPVVLAMFLAQVFHESGAFYYVTELASGAAYEGRKDLGNTQKGDGKRFKGRGFIQITGRYNYTQLSEALGFDFVSSPEELSLLPWCALSAGWYWNSRNLTKIAEQGDENAFRLITKRINGGYNGYEDRKKYWNKTRKVLGV